jgi:multidrug efflux pump
MAKFFIDRPIFAWVIALFVLVGGVVSILQLPVAQYPTVAPPAIVVTVVYPGASAKTLEDSVLTVIEQEMNGSPGLIYMESVAQANGSGTLTLTFQPGTRPRPRAGRCAEPPGPRHAAPAAGRHAAGRSRGPGAIELPAVHHPVVGRPGKFDPIALGDYAARNVLPEIQRLPGVGQAQLFGTERAMRIWLDPAKLVGFGLSTTDVNAAIRAQNAQVSSGTIGDLPNLPGQTMFATLLVDGQLASIEEFGNISLRANPDGSAVLLRDVARIELGAQTYATAARLNGKPSAGIGVQLSPSGNALDTAKAVRTRMDQLQRYFPPGVKYSIPYRHLALRADLDLQGGGDLARSRGPGVPGDVPVPAELALHDHPDHRGADGVAGHLRRAADAGLLDQRADDVRHGAGGGHRGRRRHRGGRERRAHHEHGRPVALARPRARRWGRSRAPSSASPWC